MCAKIVKAFLKITILFLAVNPSYGQWSDDFSDGDFTNNPAWNGRTVDFIVETEALRLNAPAVSATSYLSTLSDISQEAQWDFWVKLDFNPSSSNYMIVYLISDIKDLTAVTNGYFLKIGGTPDEISLYKISGGIETLLIDGVDGRVGSSTVEVNIQVTRDATGLWEVKSKLLGETGFTSEGAANDLEIKESTYFGFVCTYTSTRSTKMYLDDISVTGSPFVDTEPPKLEGYTTPDNNQIQLVFNESLDPTASENTSNYLLNGSSQPYTATLVHGDTVMLEFSTNLELVNSLHIFSLKDITGNILDTLIENLHFIDLSPHQLHEVVFNELFPDPSPPIDLPEYEFVELLNTSDRIIDLSGWTFTDGSTTAMFESVLLYPDTLLIICPEAAQEFYEPYGTTIGLSSWPTLNNTGDTLMLIDESGSTIDSLVYATEWYNNNEKDEGGWTLEKITLDSKCEGKYNWAASLSSSGGTPGEPNAWSLQHEDTSPPTILGALVEKDSLKVWLNEATVQGNYLALILPNQETVNLTLGQPSDFLIAPMEQTLDGTKTTTLEISLEDCTGNEGTSSGTLIPITSPKQGDLVINELLFNPYTGGSDFVEVFNTTPYFFNLQSFSLANETTSEVLTDSILVIEPNHYWAFSEDILFLKTQYLAPDNSLFETDLPTMPNEDGLLVLLGATETVLDSVYYSEDYHFALLDDVEGVSLERVSPTVESNNSDNWKSAAQTVGFATPGYANSQSVEVSLEGRVTVKPKVITPNNDGQADYCQITFELSGADNVISVNIYNLNGQLINTLANNVLTSPQGFFTWDGTNEQGSPLPTAHYIIVSEVVRSDGRTQRFRNKVVVANGF